MNGKRESSRWNRSDEIFATEPASNVPYMAS